MINSVIIKDIRIQAICDGIIRVEKMRDGAFCDGNTLFVPDRSVFGGAEIARADDDIVIGDTVIRISGGDRSAFGLYDKAGSLLYEYSRRKNSGELPSPDKTPKVFAVYDNPRVILPDHGYTPTDEENCGYVCSEDVDDVYLIVCRGDAKALRRLYVFLTGRSELVRLSTLGLWDSKYYAYTQEQAMRRILDYDAYDISLDNIVIDTDWREAANGMGYDINEKLFPDMKKFIFFAHDRGVEVVFNDHPEPVAGTTSVFDREEVAYREKNLCRLFDMGLDVWWYDRNWHASLNSPLADVKPETLGLYIYHDITKRYFARNAERGYARRPVILGNVCDIKNGLYTPESEKNISDSASHRFSVQWTGDIDSTYDSLTNEIHSLIRGGNNCIPYINADCGGHIGNPTAEEYVRWMQFGCFSPIIRPHCTNADGGVYRTREPWAYDGKTLATVKKYLQLRARLLQVIYKNAYESYLTGMPIFKSLAFEYADDERACRCFNEYTLGDDILVAPVTKAKLRTPVSAQNFVGGVHVHYYKDRQSKTCEFTAEYPDMYMFDNRVRDVPHGLTRAEIKATVLFPTDIELFITYSGDSAVWVDGRKVLDREKCHTGIVQSLGEINGGVPHEITVDHIRSSKMRLCLHYAEPGEISVPSIYLPRGRWLDLSDGEVCDGQRYIEKSYATQDMPLFVRLGAAIPLCRPKKNAKSQCFDSLALDCYPSRDASDSGYIYEDDGETVAYKHGMIRKTPYSAAFENGDYVVRIEKAQGEFEDDKCSTRTMSVRVHTSTGERPTSVFVNGSKAPFASIDKDAAADMLATDGGARGVQTFVVDLTQNVDRACEVRFVFLICNDS